MTTEQAPNAEATEEQGSFLDQFQNFELGLPLSDHETIDDTGNVEEENDPLENASVQADEIEEAEVESTPEEVVDTPATNNDERVEVLFELMRTGNLLAESDEFEATVDNLPKAMDKVALNLFEGYIAGMPPMARDLIVYMSKQDQNFGLEQAHNFFKQYVEPVETFKVPSTDEEAMNYLQQKFTQEKVFPSDDDLQLYLDTLLEKGKLMEVAKPKAEEDLNRFNTLRQQQLEQAEQANAQRMEDQKAYYASVFDSIDSQSWDDSRKQAVRQAVDPKRVVEMNKVIAKSPEAVAQLALLYSFYDTESNTFDLSLFGEAVAGKKVAVKKKTLEQQNHESILSKLNSRSAGSKTETGFFESLKPATK